MPPRDTARSRTRNLLWLALFFTSITSAPAQIKEVVLHNFGGSPPYGANPNGGVVRDSAGNLYGTTSAGGAPNLGVVFKVDTSAKLTVLHTFTGGADGANPTEVAIWARLIKAQKHELSPEAAEYLLSLDLETATGSGWSN